MISFVLDASATLPWCFPDEATPWTEALLDRLAAGESALAPAHWPTEVSNRLLSAIWRGRIDRARADRFLEELSSLRVVVEPPLSTAQSKTILSLSLEHELTFYDAAYLELALRHGLPIATLDAAVVKAAKAESLRPLG